ncbi:MAG: NTP transferase domain-containing protein, partial [Pseudobutyrivibrio sp.]|nr:NTP transferase domain-containing protein [Pseudobutyrivibrio sp.]
MRQIAIIPSRYGSSRFPGKPLQIIAGKPMIEYVYKNTIKAKRLDDVYVATDDDRIYNCVKAFGGKAVMTSKDIACGTDRVGNCAKILGLTDEDIVYNIQGDEPLIRSEMIDELIDIFDDSDVYMGTLKKKIESDEELNNPNIVKV